MDIRLLGPIEVSRPDGEVELGPRQQRGVLAMLALQPNRTITTDQLIDGLWADHAPASAPKIVQLYVSQLRRLLPDAEIVTRGRGYELRLDPARVDAVRFERLVVEASAADGAPHAREALALWRGSVLDDVADEPFAAAEIRRLEELRLRACELAIERDLADGRHRDVIGELEALVAEHPLAERLHAQRMLALYRSGRQAEALAAFRAARRMLVEEIGVEPGAELQRLQDAVLHHDPGLDLPAAGAAPPPRGPAPAAGTTAPPGEPPATARRGARRLAIAAGLTLLVAIATFAVSRAAGPDRLARIDEHAVGVIDSGDARITAQYPAGRGASAMTAGSGSVWVANADDDTVSRIDRAAGRLVTIPVGPHPSGVAFAAGSLWVIDAEQRTLSQVSPATNRIVREVEIGNAPSGLAAGFGALWISSAVDRTVARFDLARGAVGRTTELGANPTAVATGAGAVWVASEESGTVFRLDPRSGVVVSAIPVGNRPSAIAAGDGAVWVANRQDNTVTRIDPQADIVRRTVPVGQDPSAIAAGARTVWVANRADGSVTRLGAGPPVTVAVQSSPTAIVVAGGAAWVATAPAPARHRGGTLALVGDPFEFHRIEPFAGYGDLQLGQLMSLVYDGLVGYRRAGGAGYGALVGNLATAVPAPSADGRTYVFRLRRGIRYSDGTPLRPSDVRASIETSVRGPGTPPFYERIVGATACVRRPARCDLSKGIVADERAGTVTVHLTAPDPELMHKLAYPFAYIVPAAHRFGGRSTPPGTGPYRFSSFARDRGARLSRNPRFRLWSRDARPDGFADQIRYRVTDSRAQVAAVQAGRADLTIVARPFGGGPLAPARIAALAARDADRLHTHPVPELDYLFLDARRPPFDDVRVRRALNYAVDRRAINERAGGAQVAQATCQYLPPGFRNYEPSCRYTLEPGPSASWSAPDLERARDLIARSRTGGMPVAVWVNRQKRGLGRYFAALLRELGYDSSLRLFADYGAYRSALARADGAAHAGVDGWYADTGGPSTFTPPFLCASFQPRSGGNGNLGGFCDRRFEGRARAAETAQPPAADPLWRAAYRRLEVAAAAVPLVNRRSATLVSDRVGNYQHHPLWGTLLDQLWVR